MVNVGKGVKGRDTGSKGIDYKPQSYVQTPCLQAAKRLTIELPVSQGYLGSWELDKPEIELSVKSNTMKYGRITFALGIP